MTSSAFVAYGSSKFTQDSFGTGLHWAKLDWGDRRLPGPYLPSVATRLSTHVPHVTYPKKSNPIVIGEIWGFGTFTEIIIKEVCEVA